MFIKPIELDKETAKEEIKWFSEPPEPGDSFGWWGNRDGPLLLRHTLLLSNN